jgi:hypothetical protein
MRDDDELVMAFEGTADRGAEVVEFADEKAKQLAAESAPANYKKLWTVLHPVAWPAFVNGSHFENASAGVWRAAAASIGADASPGDQQIERMSEIADHLEVSDEVALYPVLQHITEALRVIVQPPHAPLVPQHLR